MKLTSASVTGLLLFALGCAKPASDSPRALASDGIPKGDSFASPAAQTDPAVGASEFSAIVDAVFAETEPWPTIRNRFDGFLKRFRNHPLAGRGRMYLAALDKMAEDDKNHQQTSDPADELVYRLRDDLGEFFGHFYNQDPLPKNPTHAGDRLLAMGWKAVPALIRGLTDSSLTHASAGAEMAMEEYRVQPIRRVGDVALFLLQQVTFQQFDDEPWDDPNWLAVMTKTQSQAKTWWDDNRTKGELQILTDALPGIAMTYEAAHALVERHPKEAPGVLRKALANVNDNVSREHILDALALCGGDSAADELRRRMTSDPALQVRITSAKALWKTHPDEALRAMIGEWENMAMTEDAEGNAENLADFLVITRRVEAIAAFTKNVRKRPSMIRRTIMWIFMGGLEEYDNQGKRVHVRETPKLAAFRAAIERLLIIELDDKELEHAEAQGNSLGFGDQTLPNPRMCDCAAQNLSRLLPKKYKFNIHPNLQEMDAMEAKFKEIYRASARAQNRS